MLVIVHLETQFHKQYTCIFVYYLLTNFHIFSSNASLVITFKPKAQKVCRALISFLYAVQK